MALPTRSVNAVAYLGSAESISFVTIEGPSGLRYVCGQASTGTLASFSSVGISRDAYPLAPIGNTFVRDVAGQLATSQSIGVSFRILVDQNSFPPGNGNSFAVSYDKGGGGQTTFDNFTQLYIWG